MCTCNADYYTPSAGNACSRLCTSVSTCNGNGTCSSAGTCQCARGVLGANCETAIVALASESVEITDVTVAVAVSVGSSVLSNPPNHRVSILGLVFLHGKTRTKPGKVYVLYEHDAHTVWVSGCGVGPRPSRLVARYANPALFLALSRSG